jgi:hypothetical protein
MAKCKRCGGILIRDVVYHDCRRYEVERCVLCGRYPEFEKNARIVGANPDDGRFDYHKLPCKRCGSRKRFYNTSPYCAWCYLEIVNDPTSTCKASRVIRDMNKKYGRCYLEILYEDYLRAGRRMTSDVFERRLRETGLSRHTFYLLINAYDIVQNDRMEKQEVCVTG